MNQPKSMALLSADPTAYEALTKGVAFMWQNDNELLVARGGDVVKLLQGLVLNDVFTLAEPCFGQLNASVNNIGRLISIFRLLHIEDMLLIDLPPGAVESGLLGHFRNHVMMEDAQFIDRSSQVIKCYISGPNATYLLSEIFHIKQKRLNQLPHYHVIISKIIGIDGYEDDIVIERLEDLNEIDTFQVILHKDSKKHLDTLLKSNGAVAVDQFNYDYVRLEQLARGRWGLELTNEIIPLEGDLNDIVSYHKGCYLGQEIIARLDSRQRFAKRLCTIYYGGKREEIPELKNIIYYEDNKKKKHVEVGKVIYSIYSNKHEGLLCRAYLKRPVHELGSHVLLAPYNKRNQTSDKGESSPKDAQDTKKRDKPSVEYIKANVIQVAGQTVPKFSP